MDELSMMTYLSQYPSAKLKAGAPLRQRTNPNRYRLYFYLLQNANPFSYIKPILYATVFINDITHFAIAYVAKFICSQTFTTSHSLKQSTAFSKPNKVWGYVLHSRATRYCFLAQMNVSFVKMCDQASFRNEKQNDSCTIISYIHYFLKWM